MPPKKNIAPKKISKKEQDITESSDYKSETESENNIILKPTKTESIESTSVSMDELEKKTIKYKPIVVSLPNVMDKKDNIINLEIEPKYSINIDYPRFDLGFHHYIHASKDKMEILNDFEGKKKVYLVTNEFERYVDDYENTIDQACFNYFQLQNKPKILSRGFFKLWELLMMFDLISVDQSDFISAHLAEGPGSFIQATMFFREMYCKNAKSDKYHAVTLHSENEKEHVPPLEDEFVKFYDKEKPQRFVLHKTYPKQVAGGFADKDNGDIMDPKTIKLFGGQVNDKVDFITADGGFNWKNENTQEQESFKLIFGQIVGAIKLQKKGGSFVCKFFETFAIVSAKFLLILSSFYENVHLIKPLMSRPSNSEKYAVCTGFKFNDKDKEYQQAVKKLEQVLEKSHKTNTNLVDLFPEYNVEPNFLICLAYLNSEIANRQLISINNILKFIQSHDYYGDAYLMNREMQVNASKFWISTFLPQKDKLKEVRKMLSDAIDVGIKRSDNAIQHLKNVLIYN